MPLVVHDAVERGAPQQIVEAEQGSAYGGVGAGNSCAEIAGDSCAEIAGEEKRGGTSVENKKGKSKEGAGGCKSSQDRADRDAVTRRGLDGSGVVNQRVELLGAAA